MSAGGNIELRRLLSSLCDGEISDSEQNRLLDLLAASADNRRQYLEYLDMHSRLLSQPLPAIEEVSKTEHTRSNEAVEASISPRPLLTSNEQKVARGPRRRRRQRQQVLRYGLVACATLAASLLLQFFGFPSIWHANVPAGDASAGNHDGQPLAYVATLTHVADCVWENAGAVRRPGSRLMPGELHLTRGIARIHFDSGPDLVVQGPAALQLVPSRTALVLSGCLPPMNGLSIRRQTPTRTDIGTEYAVPSARAKKSMSSRAKWSERPSAALAAQARRLAAGSTPPRSPLACWGQPTALIPNRSRLSEPKPPRGSGGGPALREGFRLRRFQGVDQSGRGGLGWHRPGGWLLRRRRARKTSLLSTFSTACSF